MEEKELYKTFNMGIGMVLVVPRKDAGKIKERLKKKHKLNSWCIGGILPGKWGIDLI